MKILTLILAIICLSACFNEPVRHYDFEKNAWVPGDWPINENLKGKAGGATSMGTVPVSISVR